MTALKPPATFHAACATLGVEVDAARLKRLGRYLHQLLEANQRFNLTGIRDPEEAWHRHVLESISLLRFLGDGVGRVVDVGSGGGVPGLPLAILRDDLELALLEATGKKARFLATTAGELGLGRVSVLSDRAETVGHDRLHRGRYDVAVARAAGPMRVLLELALPLLRVGGRLLALKGAKVEEEMQEMGDALEELGGGMVTAHLALPDVQSETVIVEVVKERPTPDRYPRRPGVPKKKPL